MNKPIVLVSVISRMNVGGPAILIDGLIRGLPEKNFNHHLITGSCADNEIDYLNAHPDLEGLVSIHKLKSMGRSILPTKDLRTLFETIRLLKAIKPDIVHTHTSKAGIIGRIASRIACPQTTVIHTFHGHLLYGYFSPLKTRLIVLLESFLARITNVLIAVTSQIENDLRSAGIGRESRWKVIHPGVTNFAHPKNRNLNQEYQSLIWIGRFTDIKNPNLAIEIMGSLKALNRSDITLIMVGNGELLESAQNLALVKKLPIEFVGWQTDVYPYLQNSDALLLTSKNEGLPIVMLEAASMSIPTFSTNVGGVAEFINDKNTGFFIDQNPDKSAVNISQALSNKSLMTKVASSANKKYQEGFSMGAFVASHVELYESLIN